MRVVSHSAFFQLFMESDDVEIIPGAEQKEESGTRSAAEAASPRCSGISSLTSTCQSTSAEGLVSWSLADLEQQRRARLHPAASAVHLVPDIVVEHVSSSTFSDTGTSRQPLFCRGLSPVSSDVVEARLSTGRQFRALSDSSVYQLGKYRHSSAVAMSPDTGRRATCPIHSSGSLDQFSSAGVVKFGGDDPAALELEMELFSSECASRETSGSTPRQHMKQPSPVSVIWPVGSPYWQPSLPSMQSLGPERSPKANWLRRHSDSNLTSGHSWQAGLRVEPYPIRSLSTGDTLLNVVSLREQPVSPAASESLHKVSKEQIPDCGHSEQQHRTVPSHLWSTAGRLWQERASPTVRKFFSEGSKQSVTHMEDLQLSERSCSENISSGEFLSQSEKVSSVKSRQIARTDESPVTSTAVNRQTEVVDMSMHEPVAATERTEGLVKKRMKLKKYLQTRYQMSQHLLLQSSDTDDVFMERVSTPDRSTSSAASATGATEPKDLSARSQLNPPTTESVFRDSERTRELDRGSSRYVSFSASSQEPSDSGTFHHPSTDRSQFPLSADELPLFVKQEPISPGIVPSGTSVFVFPSTLPSNQESTEWKQLVRPQSSSPVHSPLSADISESYHPVFHFPRVFRQPSFPGEEGPYSVTGLRMGHQRMTDFGAIYHRRACSLAVSTEISPLTRSEALPATLQHRRTIAVPEMMSMSFPAARLSLAESFPHQLQSGSRWHHHHLAGRQSSSSIEDPANFSCPVCYVIFPSYRHLADHMIDHVSASPPPALEPGEHSEAEVASSESSGGPKAVHLCPICQRSFSRGDMLTRHVRLHTGIRPYECTLCSQVFSRSDHLTTHQRTHTGEKPYRCSLCEYAAPRRDMVTRHARIHESSSSAGHGGCGRRGRRARSTSNDRGSGGLPARSVYGRAGQGRRSWRHRSDSSGFASRQHWSPSTCDDFRSSTSSSCRWSLASSSSIESTDSAVVMVGSRLASAAAGRAPPVTSHAWSTASVESFESYPGVAHHRSSLSSAPCDSPDVFVMQPRYFQWGIEASSGSEATVTTGSSTSVSINVGESSSSSVSADVAGVMPALQKCSVTSPAVSDHDPSTDID